MTTILVTGEFSRAELIARTLSALDGDIVVVDDVSRVFFLETKHMAEEFNLQLYRDDYRDTPPTHGPQRKGRKGKIKRW